MAKWPSATSYPGTPKAYPASPKVYPGTLNAYPGGGAAPAETPATILAGSTFRWLEVGMGETLTADSGAGASDCGGGGGAYVVDALADQSGGGFNVAQTTSARPRKEDAGFNGFPCFAGDAVDDRFQSTGTSIAASVSGVNQPFVRLTVMQGFVAGATLIPWSMGANATTPFQELFFSSANAYTVRKNVGANVDVTGGTTNLNRHVVIVECQGATASVDVDGVNVVPAAAYSNGSMTFDRDAIMCLRRNSLTNFAPMRVALDIFVVGTITAQQKADLVTYAQRYTAAQTKPLLAMTGDSHTNTDLGETTWMTLAAAYFPGSTFINNGVVGDTLVNMLSKDAVSGLVYRYADSNHDTNRVVCAYGNHYGANDIEGASSRTAVQVRTDQTTWATAVNGRRPTAPRIACTLHKIGGLPAGKETERVAYNTDMRANYLTYGFTHLLDKDVIIPELPSDTSVFEGDAKHLNAQGEQYLFDGRFGTDGMKQILTSLGFV
jgi:hypothetical protein